MLSLRLLTCFTMLAYASYSDLKTREVSDKLWVIFSLIGIAFNSIALIFDFTFQLLTLIIASIVITFLISFTLYYLGFFGGADMKALIVIALLLPTYDSLNYLLLHPFISITSLTNGSFLVLSLPIIFFIKNTIRYFQGKDIFAGFEGERLWKKVLVCFLGYRVKKADEGNFLMSLERIVDDKKRFHISLLTDEDYVSGEDVWVTPGVPLLIFISLGFISTVLFGDFLTLIFRLPY